MCANRKASATATPFLVGVLIIGILESSSILFCFLLAALARRGGGLASVVGAFIAGLVRLVADIFTPVFLVRMGAIAPTHETSPFTPQYRRISLLAVALIGIAILGKAPGGELFTAIVLMLMATAIILTPLRRLASESDGEADAASRQGLSLRGRNEGATTTGLLLSA